MPGLNGKGPNGQGSMTGRGMGRCGTGENVENFAGRGLGRGMQAGRGRGLGRGNRFNAPDIDQGKDDKK